MTEKEAVGAMLAFIVLAPIVIIMWAGVIDIFRGGPRW